MTRVRGIATVVAVLLGLGLLIIVFFNRLTAGNLILARGDTLLYFYPYWKAAAEALAAGRMPLWNPNLFMGAPFLANSQVGFFYPLNWPFWLLFSTPYAASFSILAHLFIAGLGAYHIGRRCLSLTRLSAFLAAIMFSLGGYLTAQVEHINQVQGIAWLPWYFVVLCPRQQGSPSRRELVRTIVSVATIASLQILSGHTQTVFITFVALSIWQVATFIMRDDNRASPSDRRSRFRVLAKQALIHFGPFVAGVILAVSMTAIQLLPTVELSRHSLREGGLPVNEVLSFSLQPLLLAQSLLPAYDQIVFTEYFLVLPIAVLLLAAIGASRLMLENRAWPFLILAITGLVLGLGRYNPLYYVLAHVPGFDLFRAPARWAVLYALSMSLLAAAGWQTLSKLAPKESSASAIKKHSRALILCAIIILALIVWRIAAVSLASFVPTSPEAEIERPSLVTLAAWAGELIVASALIYLIIRGRIRGDFAKWLILIGLVVILFLGTRLLPYNHPTTPEAFYDLRPPITRLLADAECLDKSASCEPHPGRLLSLSDIFFDMGDQAEIESIYQDQLGARESFDYMVAVKQKEILGPNLPLAYDLQSVDGFDGGVLPLASYANLVSLILPDGLRAYDGRLREHLDAIPEERWLDLFRARYIITDKVGDEWRQGVFFDLKHPVDVQKNGEPVAIGHVPAYEATEVWLMADSPVGKVEVVSAVGEEWLLQPSQIEPDLWSAKFPKPTNAQRIALVPCSDLGAGDDCADSWRVQGLALVDRRDGTFSQIVAGAYRLIHSGDVKIYENLDILPRALLIYDWLFVSDEESGLEAMRQEDFDPGKTAVVIGDGESSTLGGQGDVSIKSEEPERIVLHASSDSRALLLLPDAHYPGWKATVDGQRTEILATDILFRGVFLLPGEHEITLEYKPATFAIGQLISAVGLTLWGVLVAYAFLFPRVHKPPAAA